ncbi:MAG: transcriptional regulator [Nitriliruptoraceae bacterium]
MSDDDRTHALAIGARLRRVRQQQGSSLADVQADSDGRWKAVVVGAYERGDRTVTLARLADLAEFYDVPLADLLPDQRTVAAAAPGRITLDLVRLDAAPARTELAILARYASRVARRRGDHNGRMLTLRAGDLETVALAVDLTATELQERLEDEGILLHLDATGALVRPEGAAQPDEAARPDEATVPVDARPQVDARTQGEPDDLTITIDLSEGAVEPDTTGGDAGPTRTTSGR